jgi:hypothetical protein
LAGAENFTALFIHEPDDHAVLLSIKSAVKKPIDGLSLARGDLLRRTVRHLIAGARRDPSARGEPAIGKPGPTKLQISIAET